MLTNSQQSKRRTRDGHEPTIHRSPVSLAVRLLSACLLLPFTFFLLPCHADGAWKRQPTRTLAWLHGVHFVDAEKGWAVGGGGVVLTTTDGGANWKAAPRPTEDALRDVYFADAQTGWLVCDRDVHKLQTKDEPRSYLLKTNDGGSTWRRVEATGTDVDVRLVRLVFADREHGWVFGEAGALYATDDGGATWQRRRVPTRHLLLGGAFLDAQMGWLVGAGATILHTVDNGATWREGRVEMPEAANVSGTSSLITNASSSAVAANNNTASATSRSTAASADAPTFKASARLRAVSFVNARRGWAVGSGGRILSTADGGRSWHTQATPTGVDLFDVKFFDESEGWAAGDDGTMLHTTDGGAHWLVVSTGTTHPLERLFFVGRTRGWAVGFGGTIITLAPATAPNTTPPRLKTTG
ncbi:MAG TPA: YCF48-related protein [Pyrinomonadaceae bacterium]|jgi:photosystem II stability/assembly factor-like uncharacterized protein